MEKIAVVYLMWLPYGPEVYQKFINSYLTFPAGMEHQLTIIFNGKGKTGDVEHYCDYTRKHQIPFNYLELASGQDIDAYFYAAQHTDVNFILFLNTFSGFTKQGWLKYFYTALNNPRVGVVGATASYQSYYSSVFQDNTVRWESKETIKINIRKYKLLLKAFFYWRFLFDRFPNPHLRTNAFMIRRPEFLLMYPGPVKTKFNAYRFENGKKSLTKRYLAKGFNAVVTGRNGAVYSPPEWRTSQTFWISEQENLLVTDNQTELFRAADTAQRLRMTKLAWGI